MECYLNAKTQGRKDFKSRSRVVG